LVCSSSSICVGTFVGFVAHVILIIPAIPQVIASGNALAPFVIAIIVLAFASGFIKSSLGPLLCDQSPVKRPIVRTEKNGERVIVDPEVTVGQYMLIFYWCINIGAFFQLATTYAEHDIGFWLAYLLPGIIYMCVFTSRTAGGCSGSAHANRFFLIFFSFSSSVPFLLSPPTPLLLPQAHAHRPHPRFQATRQGPPNRLRHPRRHASRSDHLLQWRLEARSQGRRLILERRQAVRHGGDRHDGEEVRGMGQLGRRVCR
jgi:hypothetical protein